MTDFPAIPDDHLRAELLRRLRLRPCHVTGFHDPNHDPDAGCACQRLEMFEALLSSLKIELGDIPRALHENCGSCHQVADRETDREFQRRDHLWAGVPISEELAKPGLDLPQEGDPDIVFEFLTYDFSTWQVVTQRMSRAGHDWHLDRYWDAIHELVEQGRAEYHGLRARRFPGD